jgi:hypothetical protein
MWPRLQPLLSQRPERRLRCRPPEAQRSHRRRAATGHRSGRQLAHAGTRGEIVPSLMDGVGNGSRNCLSTGPGGTPVVALLTGDRHHVPPQARGAPIQLFPLVDATATVRGTRGRSPPHPDACSSTAVTTSTSTVGRWGNARAGPAPPARFHVRVWARPRLEARQRIYAWLCHSNRLRIRYEASSIRTRTSGLTREGCHRVTTCLLIVVGCRWSVKSIHRLRD